MKRLYALWRIFRCAALAEWHYLRTHGWDTSMLSWIPLATVLLMWWIFSAVHVIALPIGVLDRDHSTLSRQLTRYLDAAPGLAVSAQYSDHLSAHHALDSAAVYAVIEIPQDFSAKIKSGHTSPVLLQYNAQFGTHAGQIQRDVQAVTATFSAGVEIHARNKRGQPIAQAREGFAPLRMATGSLFNPSVNYRQFLAAAMIPALLHIFAMTAGAYAIGREIRDGQLGEWFAATGGNLKEYLPFFWEVVFALNGKLLWSMLSFTLSGALTLLLVSTGSDIPFPNLLAAFSGLWLMMLVSFWLGVIVTVIPMSLRLGLSTTAFITAPSFAFAGITFPLLAMPPGARLWAQILPLTHYLRLQTMLLQMNIPVLRVVPTLVGFILVVTLLLLVSGFLTRRAFLRTVGER